MEEDAVVELTPMSIEKGYDFIKQIEIDLNHAYGIACDIGTTSIACYLVDLDTYAICDYLPISTIRWLLAPMSLPGSINAAWEICRYCTTPSSISWCG